ncbi:MAG: PHP domain-containing protein [Kiritimatiellae bacterium]|nr:PHP domain-containing protein [Kiritimatiellia bacterium]
MRCDYHIHTHYLGCGNSTMSVVPIVAECERRGVKSIAITDHLNAIESLEKHQPIREDIQMLVNKNVEVYFGVELNFLPDGTFPYDEEIAEKMGFQFAIGGPHETFLDTWDTRAFVARQHERHLATCRHPLVSVLVHPWWFARSEFEKKGFPWPPDLDLIPKSMIAELGSVARETNTAIEINACAIFANPAYPFAFKARYVEYLAALAEEGPQFALCTDAHDISQLAAIPLAEAACREAGIPPERIWHPPMKPLHQAENDQVAWHRS